MVLQLPTFPYASPSSHYGKKVDNISQDGINYVDCVMPSYPINNQKRYSIINNIEDSKHYVDDLNSFPPGYRFNPTEEELIIFYLMKKVRHECLPPNQMFDVDVYQNDPEIVCNAHKNFEDQKEWYFFSPRERKYKNGARPKRSTRDGYWKVSGSDKLIFSNGMLVGNWNTLVYYRGKAPTGIKTNWIMREYKLAHHSHKRTNNMDMMLDDFVLCKIYKKAEVNSKSKSKGMRNEEQEEEVINKPQCLNNGYDPSYSKSINPLNSKYDSSGLELPGYHHYFNYQTQHSGDENNMLPFYLDDDTEFMMALDNLGHI